MDTDSVASAHEYCAEALDRVDFILADPSHDKVKDGMVEAIGYLTSARNVLIDCGENRQLLAGINPLLSVMASIEYPLGGIHTARLQQSRSSLAALVLARSTMQP